MCCLRNSVFEKKKKVKNKDWKKNYWWSTICPAVTAHIFGLNISNCWKNCGHWWPKEGKKFGLEYRINWSDNRKLKLLTDD